MYANDFHLSLIVAIQNLENMDHSAFDTLFKKNVPHLLEKIFFLLDYESYKLCLKVSIVWKDLLTSQSFQMRGRSVFHKDILRDGMRLWLAAKAGDKDKARELLSTGMVNVDSCIASTMSRSALSVAAYFGQKGMVQLLFSKGADINKKDLTGKCPIHNAAERGKFDTVRLLIVLGAEPPLTMLAYNGQKAIIQMLLRAGANPNMRDSEGHTALTRAALKGHEDIVRLLLQNRAKLNEGDQYGNTPLNSAARCGYNNVVQQLIDGGADLSKGDLWGQTPLFNATMSNKTDIVKLLIDNGADQNISNDNNLTPLSYARMKGFSDIINILKNQGPPGQ